MKRAVRVAIAVLLVAGLIWGIRRLFPSDREKIVRQLNDLASTVSTAGAETDVARMAKAARIGRFFTEDVTVDLGPPQSPIQGRGTLVALAASAREQGRLRVEFIDVQIAIGPGSMSASVDLTAKVSGPDSEDGRPAVDAREFRITFQKVRDEWLISRVEGVRTLEQRP